jgi:hypothetical protein
VPRGGLAIAFAASAAWLGAAVLRRRAPPGTAFLLLCGLLLVGLLLVFPGAERAHHLMNLYPFPHWIASLGLVALWGEGRPAQETRSLRLAVRRAAAGALLVALLAANLHVVWRTHAEIERSGGRGYWSDAVVGFAEEVSAAPGARVVCLDWGLHNQVAFLAAGVRSLDAIWQVRRDLARGDPWRFAGDAGTLYLLHPEPFDLFGLGGRFQSALEGVAEDRVEVRSHLDREGGVAFLAVRLRDPHRILYDGRRFSIAFERAIPSDPQGGE